MNSGKGETVLLKRLHVRLPTYLMNYLEQEAKERRVSRREIVESALWSRYDPPQQIAKDAIIARRLTRIDKRISSLEKQEEIIAESLAMYIKMWLMVNDELPEEKRKLVSKKSIIRYESFLEAVARKVANGSSYVSKMADG